MSSSIDRLSDDVTCHILSFLPTRTSVSTSVLARRWRFLWAHVPNLDFKGDDFKDQTRASVIIHRVMALHRAQTITTFLLFDDVSYNGHHMATCISHAVNLGVRNLYLEFTNSNFVVEYSFTPPRNLLTCNTLVDLKLRCCRVNISSSGSKVFLPSLKKLHLNRIMYKNDESLPRLISGCPVLEDLVVQDCFKDKRIVGDDLGCVFVFSPTIKTLNVDVLEGCRVLKINSPSLVYLKVIRKKVTFLFPVTEQNMAPVDRLSGLPDDVIIHILSFLPTKISASTDVLARRWRFSWTHVPNLFFDEECRDPAVIDRVIALHRAKTMNTLSFDCDIYKWRQDQLATWITHALNRGVRNLYLDVGNNPASTFTLPEYFFTCKTLVDVSLYECRGISSTDKVFLPSLKKLFLSRIKCDDDETLPTLPHLISGCPVLQDLIIEDHYCWDSVLVVSSLTIKYLEVDLDVVIDECDLVVLKINAPSLQYLKVRNFN